MTLKSDIINGAYSRIRISGLTVQASPEDIELAIDRLEDFAHELSAINICIGYNFENEPDINSESGVDRKFKALLETNLAVRVLSDFGKEIPLPLGLLASSTLSSAASITASEKLREVQYPNRMPLGSGNQRAGYCRTYRPPDPLPPNECDTKEMDIGEVNDYTADFSAYLLGEEISSYVITADTGLNIETDSNDDPVISYRIKAVSNTTDGSWQQVKIQITTSTGRVEIRVINFNISQVSEVT